MFALSSWGILLININCVRVFDIKIIIAYSSVAHIGLALIGLISFTKTGVFSGMFIILTHAFRSSGLFLVAFQLYTQRHSRRLLITKGALSITPFLSLLWLLVVLAGMGTPPFSNLFSEIFCFSVIVRVYTPIGSLIFPAVLAASAYSLVIYSAPTQRAKVWSNSSTKKSNPRLLLNAAAHARIAVMLTFSV